MKRYASSAAGLIAITAFASSAMAADIGVSIRVGDPGFYGQIDLGNVPQPRLIYERPVIIQAPPMAVRQQPIYLVVPPGHAKDWGKHCRHYNACGQSVYFVDNNWYSNVYVPEYSKQHGNGKGKNKNKDKGRDDDNRGQGRDGDDDRGNGNGHGKGKGKDK